MDINSFSYKQQISPSQLNAQSSAAGTAQQRPRTNEVQPREAPSAQSQRNDEKRQELTRAREDVRSSAERETNTRAERGSLVDVVA
jgi:hypothetical protein